MTELPKTTVLTSREREIVHWLSYGYTNVEIGALLHLSPYTVKTHLARIAAKVGVAERAGIVGACFRAGVLAVEA